MNKLCTLEVNGIDYKIPEEIVKSYIQFKQERDKYKSIIEMVRDIIKKQLLSNTNITKFTDEMCLELIFNKIKQLEEGNSND